ncbi:hypothetical protein HFO97_22255 [Rhizobium leguminosarum]|uniref:hypothetical protein n=1 Tax=Rhizobium leguminosarum TaxID=384 RepID=UPI001C986383|nr:hypothetical protein [Rhizobium leguminosarum]MBY5362618.1 hypothetical protein [Rhizobium leguminosarum]
MAKKPTGKKNCFVVGPIGDDDSDDRVHADWLLEEIIEPVFAEHFPEFRVSRADRMPQPGQITTQVITALLEAELVIADLSTLNPNAFYEIGIRHTIQKPIIHMHLENQRIPFDVAAVRSVKFARRRPSDLRAARTQLVAMVKEAIDPEHLIDNPVTFSRGVVQFAENATPSDRLLLDQIAMLTERLDRMEFLGYGDFEPPRGKIPADHFTIKAKNGSPATDVQTALRKVISGITGAELHPVGRNEATLFMPKNETARVVMKALTESLSRDYIVSLEGEVYI